MLDASNGDKGGLMTEKEKAIQVLKALLFCLENGHQWSNVTLDNERFCSKCALWECDFTTDGAPKIYFSPLILWDVDA